MKKDIFIDNNIAKNFSNPQDEAYKRLTRWLLRNDQDSQGANAYLVVSQKLLKEYYRSSRGAKHDTSIPVIIDKLTREGRLIKTSNKEIKAFQRQHFTKTLRKKLRSNRDDWDHIPVVLLSVRKYGLSLDNNLIYDLMNFPGFVVRIERQPDNLPYDD